MSRVVTMATILFAIGAATTLYQVKYEVRGLEAEARGLVTQVDQARDQIRVLNAEWSYLNRPSRVQDLAERYLSMKPMAEAQFTTIAQLPMRPDDAPPVQSLPPMVNAAPGQAGAVVASNNPNVPESMPVPTLRPRPPVMTEDGARVAPVVPSAPTVQVSTQTVAPTQAAPVQATPARVTATQTAAAQPVAARPAPAASPGRKIEGALPSLTPLFVSIEGAH